MGLPSKARVTRPIERRKQRPRIVINVTEPGQIIIDQGTREDHLGTYLLDSYRLTTILRNLPGI